MTAQDYIPVFDDSVQGFLPNDPQKRMWNYSQYYCLMVPSARQLASLFSPAPDISLAPPIQVADGSPFAFSHLVPWFTFTLPDGSKTLRNAGQLAIYWGMAGVSDPLAQAQADVAVGS